VVASGWNDYRLEIAPGFAVLRMNNFEVCLGSVEGNLYICPGDFSGQLGPLVQYSVTDSQIYTRHEGAMPHEQNSSMRQGDPSKEYFFVVDRETKEITGPLEANEFHRSYSSGHIKWQNPKNPKIWTPLLGNLMFFGFYIVFVWWPILIVFLAIVLAIWFWKRRAKSAA